MVSGEDLPLGGILLTSGAEPSTGEVVIWKYHCTRENYLKYIMILIINWGGGDIQISLPFRAKNNGHQNFT